MTRPTHLGWGSVKFSRFSGDITWVQAPGVLILKNKKGRLKTRSRGARDTVLYGSYLP